MIDLSADVTASSFRKGISSVRIAAAGCALLICAVGYFLLGLHVRNDALSRLLFMLISLSFLVGVDMCTKWMVYWSTQLRRARLLIAAFNAPNGTRAKLRSSAPNASQGGGQGKVAMLVLGLAEDARKCNLSRDDLIIDYVTSLAESASEIGNASTLEQVEALRFNSTQASIEAEMIIPRFIVWLMPALGFIGTIVGLRDGFGAISQGLVQNVGGEGVSPDSMVNAIRPFFDSFSVAFEATLAALAFTGVLDVLSGRLHLC